MLTLPSFITILIMDSTTCQLLGFIWKKYTAHQIPRDQSYNMLIVVILSVFCWVKQEISENQFKTRFYSKSGVKVTVKIYQALVNWLYPTSLQRASVIYITWKAHSEHSLNISYFLKFWKQIQYYGVGNISAMTVSWPSWVVPFSNWLTTFHQDGESQLI